jgi:hypothetical protein
MPNNYRFIAIPKYGAGDSGIRDPPGARRGSRAMTPSRIPKPSRWRTPAGPSAAPPFTTRVITAGQPHPAAAALGCGDSRRPAAGARGRNTVDQPDRQTPHTTSANRHGKHAKPNPLPWKTAGGSLDTRLARRQRNPEIRKPETEPPSPEDRRRVACRPVRRPLAEPRDPQI